MDVAAFHTGSGHPDAVAARVVIAAVIVAGEHALRIHRAPKLAAPDDERVIEHAAFFELGQKRGGGLVGVVALAFDATGQVVVLVPAAMVELDEAHTPLGEPTGEDAVRGIRSGLLRLGAVALVDVGGFFGEISEVRHGGLHAEGHLVLIDPGLRFGIVVIGELEAVQRGDIVEHGAAPLGGDAGRIGKEEHGVFAGAHAHALILRGQKAAAPHALVQRLRIRRSARSRNERDKGRQVRVVRAEAIRHPCAKRGPTADLMPGLQQRHRWIVIDRLGVQRADEADLIRELRGVRQQLTQPHAALAMLRKLEHRRRDGEALLPRRHAREPLLATHGVRQILVKLRGEPRLVIKQIELRRRTRLREPDDALRPRRKVSRRRGKELWIREGSEGEALEPVATRKRGEGGFGAHEVTPW